MARTLLDITSMKLERTSEGLNAELRVTGISRYFGAAFLAFWLVGWAVGEAIVLWILAVGAWSLFTGRPPEPGRQPFAPAAALPTGLFLLFWVTLWTFGGLMAVRELLRLLFGRDRMLATEGGLEIEHKCGPLRSRKKLLREEIRRFYRRPHSAALCVETSRGTTELTRLGSAAERAELEHALNAEFPMLAAEQSAEGALPAGWCKITSPEHHTVLVKDPSTRRKQAIVAWGVFALISSPVLYLLFATQMQPSTWALALSLVAVAGLVGWGAVWLSSGRREWRLENGRLILQSRFGQNLTTRFEAVSLELIEDTSGEDGTSYHLTAVAAAAPPRPCSYRIGKHRRILHSQTDDPTEPRNFGLWLVQRCHLPFEDQTTSEAKAKSLEELKQQLANSGRFGRAALRLIERFTPPDRQPRG